MQTQGDDAFSPFVVQLEKMIQEEVFTKAAKKTLIEAATMQDAHYFDLTVLVLGKAENQAGMLEMVHQLANKMQISKEVLSSAIHVLQEKHILNELINCMVRLFGCLHRKSIENVHQHSETIISSAFALLLRLWHESIPISMLINLAVMKREIIPIVLDTLELFELNNSKCIAILNQEQEWSREQTFMCVLFVMQTSLWDIYIDQVVERVANWQGKDQELALLLLTKKHPSYAPIAALYANFVEDSPDFVNKNWLAHLYVEPLQVTTCL